MSDHVDVDDYRFGRARLALGKLTAAAVCLPQLKLGRRRHDNHCDECGEFCGPYAMERLAFPFETSAEATSDRSTVENIRGMLNADYRRVCLECGSDQEGEQ